MAHSQPGHAPEPADKLCLVDVGGAGGLEPEWHPHANSISPVFFEPNPEAAQRLRDSLRYATVIDRALSNSSGRKRLYVTRNPLCTSLLKPNAALLQHYGVAPHFEVVGESEVECARYDSLHQAGLAPAPDALKIDVQAHEYQVLLGFGGLLQHCLAVQIETQFYPVYEGQKLIHDAVTLLEAYGLVLRRVRPSSNFMGDLVEADVYFTRNCTSVRTLDEIQRKKLQLISEVWQLAPYRL